MKKFIDFILSDTFTKLILHFLFLLTFIETFIATDKILMGIYNIEMCIILICFILFNKLLEIEKKIKGENDVSNNSNGNEK